MSEFAVIEWNRALRTMATAEKIADDDPDSAASRAYYAAFYALTALFALRDQTFSKHSALRAALHRELIKRRQWHADLGQAYDFLLDMRETGDYGGLIHVSSTDAKVSIEKAAAIIKAVAKSCPEFREEQTS